MKLVFKNISKSYRDKDVLKEISFELTPGVYELLGPNGAGQTTLMKIVCRLFHPSGGQIFWNGKLQIKLFIRI